MDDELRAVRAVVSGKVQGVFYRASALEQAQGLGLVGSVKNLPGDEVEIVAQGAPDAVEALLRWAHRGPPEASVQSVAISDIAEDRALKTFVIAR